MWEKLLGESFSMPQVCTLLFNTIGSYQNLKMETRERYIIPYNINILNVNVENFVNVCLFESIIMCIGISV
jgi:hypothetical protein